MECTSCPSDFRSQIRPICGLQRAVTRNRLASHLQQSCAARKVDNPCARTHYSALHFGGLMKFTLLLSLVAALAASSTSVFAADVVVKLTVDASKTGSPISKYIYGQFAEHLGRSIYGGLWAEM